MLAFIFKDKNHACKHPEKGRFPYQEGQRKVIRDTIFKRNKTL